MTEKDNLHRFIFDKAPVRGEFVRLEESFQTIAAQHDYPPPLKRLVGEALAVAGLLSAIIKSHGRLTLQFRGKGRLKLLLAQCDNQSQLRALAKWDGIESYEDLMEAFNDGVLVITVEMGGSKPPYQGIVAWQGNSLVESIEAYFQKSEQLLTKIWLSVNDTTAAGMLLQVMPNQNNTFVLEEPVIHQHWDRLIQLTASLCEPDLLMLDFMSLLKTLFPNEDIRIFDPARIKFGCTCSRKRGADAILILGREEAEDELKGKTSISVTCDFCNKEYIFDRVDVAKIFEDDQNKPPETPLH